MRVRPEYTVTDLRDGIEQVVMVVSVNAGINKVQDIGQECGP
jgi:hypothetical protein